MCVFCVALTALNSHQVVDVGARELSERDEDPRHGHGKAVVSVLHVTVTVLNVSLTVLDDLDCLVYGLCCLLRTRLLMPAPVN